MFKTQTTKKNKLITLMVAALVGVIVVALVTGLIRSGTWEKEGKYDALAKCLTEKGATLYTTYWCPHCTEQKKLFGSSLKYVNVVECDAGGENAEPLRCQKAGVTSIPAWHFPDGTKETGLHTMKELADITDCPQPQE